MPYVYKRRLIDTQNGVRNDGDLFKVDNSAVVVHTDVDITIKEKEVCRSQYLWELFTRKILKKLHVTSDDLRREENISNTNAHSDGYKSG